jgi:hypothetical protein
MTHDAAATKVQLFKRSPIRPRDQVIEYRAILLRLLRAASGPNLPRRPSAGVSAFWGGPDALAAAGWRDCS